jgi:ketosteroid isomerase-like protein
LAHASSEDVARVVGDLDTQFQKAVKDNDVGTIDRILADDFVVVTGGGKTYGKSDLLAEARTKERIYERQEDYNRTVRVYGNTAVVTAILWAKGTSNAGPFEYRLWFSDVYVKTPGGWRYVFGQASKGI